MEEIENQTSPARLIFGMLTACITGVGLAFSAILGSQFVLKSLQDAPVQTATVVEASSLIEIQEYIDEEPEEDPSFVSSFSRVFMYSADNGREIIESAKNSLPTLAKDTITATGYAVIDFDRDVIILEKDSDKLLPIASITKLVTAVVAKRLLKSTTPITITKSVLTTYGNEAWLREGEKLKPEELMYPLLMVSSNDSAEALAQGYPKGRKEFIKEMNDWVSSIGAYRTYFADPSGLSFKNVSTAKDLTIITKWILENEPEIFDITLLKSKTIRTHTWTNPAHFLNLTSYAGGKNGYTPEANRTSVALFKLGGGKKIFGVVLLDSSNRDGDILDLLEETVR